MNRRSYKISLIFFFLVAIVALPLTGFAENERRGGNPPGPIVGPGTDMPKPGGTLHGDFNHDGIVDEIERRQMERMRELRGQADKNNDGIIDEFERQGAEGLFGDPNDEWGNLPPLEATDQPTDQPQETETQY